jgi:uncharacterized protein YutE (UPF0331/DUF86 family)
LALANDMRNALAHGYFKVDLDIAWETIHSELSPLHALVSTLQQVLAHLFVRGLCTFFQLRLTERCPSILI